VGLPRYTPTAAPAVLALHFGETASLPRRAPPARRPLATGRLRAVAARGCGLDVLHVDDGGRLRADVAPAEGIIGSPRTRLAESPSISTVRPHTASQSMQVWK